MSRRDEEISVRGKRIGIETVVSITRTWENNSSNSNSTAGVHRSRVTMAGSGGGGRVGLPSPSSWRAAVVAQSSVRRCLRPGPGASLSVPRSPLYSQCFSSSVHSVSPPPSSPDPLSSASVVA